MLIVTNKQDKKKDESVDAHKVVTFNFIWKYLIFIIVMITILMFIYSGS